MLFLVEFLCKIKENTSGRCQFLKNVTPPPQNIDAIKEIIDDMLVYIDWKFKEEICDHYMKTASSWILN